MVLNGGFLTDTIYNHRERINSTDLTEIKKIVLKSKEEGKDQELIQLSTKPDPRHHMGKWQKHKETSHMREPKGQKISEYD